MAIPIQIVSRFEWNTLPIVALAGFALLGILEIGQEIENPFSYAANDLPLDQFCEDIRLEMEHVLMQSPVQAKDWISSDKNMPFYPKSFQTASELMRRSPEELENIMRRLETGPQAAAGRTAV